MTSTYCTWNIFAGNEAPLVSVVIPCYNHGAYIRDAVESVCAQTFSDVEMVIVDDGSNNQETRAVLAGLSDAGYRVIRTKNNGPASARNTGIANSRGRYILPLDADDLIAPEFIERAVPLLENNPQTKIVCTDAVLIGDESGVRRLPDFSPERILSENILFATALFRKADWQTVGGYCTALRSGWEDWDFWIAMTRGGATVSKIPEPLFTYRIRSSSRDRSLSMWQKGCMLLIILFRHFDHYVGSPGSFVRLIRNSRKFSDKNN